MIEVQGFIDAEETAILATIDGLRVTIPNDMTNRYRQALAEWETQGNTIPTYVPRFATPADVKAECRRRILLIMTEDQQRNTLAAGQAATMRYGSDPSNWPAALRARQAAALAAWAEIERLRTRSNEIEAMDPIPAQVAADYLWEVNE